MWMLDMFVFFFHVKNFMINLFFRGRSILTFVLVEGIR